jgi:hypothetical protein
MTDTSGLRIKLEAAQHRIAELEELLERAQVYLRPYVSTPEGALYGEIESALAGKVKDE